MNKRVRTLLRVSSRQQLHNNDIPIQRAEVEQYIESRTDWEFDGEYIEKAVSAYKNSVEDREVLQQILADAKTHQFEVLLAYMSDRIGRHEEYSFYVSALNQLGIEVWTIKDGQLKTEEHVDKLLNYIRFWQNEGESKKTSIRVRDTQAELIKSGKFLGGKAPYGYKLVPSDSVSNHVRLLKKLIIVEKNAEIVRKIYRFAVYRGMGYEKIAKALNEEGIPAVTTDKWKAGTIASILRNPIYMGYPCINRRVNHGGCIRLERSNWIYSEEQQEELIIVPTELWEKAQEIREARKAKISTTGKENNVPFCTRGNLALIGLVYCGYCGKLLKNGSYSNYWTLKSTGERKMAYMGRYLCPERCPKRSCYSQSYLEKIIFQVVENYMEKIKNIDISDEIDKLRKEQFEGLESEIHRIYKEQKILKQDIVTLEGKIPEAIRGEGFFSEEKLSALIAEKLQLQSELTESVKVAECKLQKAKLQYDNMQKMVLQIPDWKEEFQSTDVATKKMIMSAMFEKIEVTDERIVIKFKV